MRSRTRANDRAAWRSARGAQPSEGVSVRPNEHDTDDDTVLAVARTEVPRLITALRGTLGNDKADVFGLCLGCAPTWVDGRFTRTPWPCAVIDSAHTCLEDPGRVFETHSPR